MYANVRASRVNSSGLVRAVPCRVISVEFISSSSGFKLVVAESYFRSTAEHERSREGRGGGSASKRKRLIFFKKNLNLVLPSSKYARRRYLL